MVKLAACMVLRWNGSLVCAMTPPIWMPRSRRIWWPLSIVGIWARRGRQRVRVARRKMRQGREVSAQTALMDALRVNDTPRRGGYELAAESAAAVEVLDHDAAVLDVVDI